MAENDYIKNKNEAEAFKHIIEKRKAEQERQQERSNVPVFLKREDFNSGKIEVYNPQMKKWVPEAMQNDSFLMEDSEAQIIAIQDERIAGSNRFFYDFIPKGYRESIEEAKYVPKVGDFVTRKGDGQVIRITKIYNNFIDGVIYGIRGYILGEIKSVSINDLILYTDTGWIKESIQEAEVNVDQIIKDLESGFGSSDEDKAKTLQLFKGIIFSDDPKAMAYLKKLDQVTTKISKEVSNKKEESSINKFGKDITLSRDRYIEGELIKKGSIIKEIK
jgi:hypothetical protein